MPVIKEELSQRHPVQEPLQKKHRLVVLQNSSLFESFGGIEYYLDDLASLASEIYGSDHAFVLAPKRLALSPSLARSYEYELVPFSANGFLRKVENRFSARYLRAALRTVRKVQPSLILCGHVSLGPLAYLLSKITQIPYVTLCYGIECWGNLWVQDEMTLRRAKGLISISEWTKKILVERGYSSQWIRIFHPQLPTCYEKMPAPLRPNREEEPFTLLSISRLDANEKYKGQDHVIQALHRIKESHSNSDIDVKYIIQGEGSDLFRLKGMVEQLGLESWVEFHPAVKDRSQFETVYRKVDVFIMPSQFGRWDGKWHGEGFGIVYLEAGAFGVPSIAYDCGGVTDIITSGKDGILVEPGNIADLAKAIIDLAESRQKVFDLGKEAHKTVMTRFTRHAVREQLIGALNKLSR